MKRDEKIKVAILTISDTRSKDTDVTGRVIRDLLNAEEFSAREYELIQDDKDQIKSKLVYYADELNLELVLTNGGTGLGPCDLTPEATLEVAERQVPGIPELMRIEGLKKTQRSSLSRGIAGIRKNTLIINLPGSPKGAGESLESVLAVIPHAIDMLNGKGH